MSARGAGAQNRSSVRFMNCCFSKTAKIARATTVIFSVPFLVLAMLKSQRHYSHDCANCGSTEYKYHTFSRISFHALPTFSAYQRKTIEDFMVARRAVVQNGSHEVLMICCFAKNDKDRLAMRSSSSFAKFTISQKYHHHHHNECARL
jgi:hypothetical protein